MSEYEYFDTSAPESSRGRVTRQGSQDSLDECSQESFPFSSQKERVPCRNTNYANKILETMDSLRKSRTLCDVILVADGNEIPAHKIILASSSPYFFVMFSKFEEGRLDRVVLKGIDAMALELLVQYIYSSEIFICEENVQALLQAASLLQLHYVREECCNFLGSQIHPSNVLGIRTFADLHGCTKLLQQADWFIEQNFLNITQEEEFLQLPVNEIINLVKNNKLVVPSEEKVFECVMKWVKHDESRQECIATIMEHVRLPLIPKDYLTQIVCEEEILKSDPKCKDYIIEALRYHLLKKEEKATLPKITRVTPRRANYPKILLVVGGQAPKAIIGVEYYDFDDERWHVMQDMPSRRCRAGVVALDGKVYAVGGFNGSLRVKTVSIYDVAADIWTAGVSMDVRRSTLGVALIDKRIYAVGGFDGTNGLQSAEVCNPETSTWSYIAPMSTRRSSVGVGVLNNMLYAVGGYDGLSRQCLDTAEYYNPALDVWQSVPQMEFRRSGAGVGVLNGVLYAVGGHDGPVVRKSVEAFDPQEGVWKRVADMNICRRNAGVVAYMDKLYVVGGDDGASNLSSVEVYCPKTNTWDDSTHFMSIGRSYAGVILIDKPLRMH